MADTQYKYKGVGYSYPTSENADRNGWDNGAWHVSLWKEKDGIPVCVPHAAPTKFQAIELAEAYPLPWHPWWLGNT
ncbi:MAG: hypothetical protein GY832_11715 [Chloroflexi bacterium]|nr:hypothetical protein [Chloroflexota bacterium]